MEESRQKGGGGGGREGYREERDTDCITNVLFHGCLQHTIRQPQHMTAGWIVCTPNEKPEKSKKIKSIKTGSTIWII